MWTLYALLAAMTAALMTIVGKVGLEKVDPTLATAVRSAFMFLFMFLIILIGGKLKGIATLDRHAFIAIAISSIFGALSWLFYFLALKDGTASRVAAIDRTSIVFIIILSMLFLAEQFSWKIVIGGVLVTIGAILVAL